MITDYFEKPEPDSQFRLVPCKCCGEYTAGYENKRTVHLYRVICPKCGEKTSWLPCKHDAQQVWNIKNGFTEVRNEFSPG